MLGNFSYCNPTKLYFGDESLDYLNTELPKYGKNVVFLPFLNGSNDPFSTLPGSEQFRFCWV